MENFTKLIFDCGLREAGNDILLSTEILDVLRRLQPEFRYFSRWQNMLFDRSTGTVDHYDSYYLDTYPKGSLVAAWVALEDIVDGCGPFRVFPKSHLDFRTAPLNDRSHDLFVMGCANYTEGREAKLALLRRGSVLFWHPSLIHGALKQTDPRLSRKSLTAHYYPVGVAKSTMRDSTDLKQLLKRLIRPLSHTRQIGDLPILVDENRVDDLIYNLMGYGMYVKNLLVHRNRPRMDMRRTK